jgi:hypothetical protein
VYRINKSMLLERREHVFTDGIIQKYRVIINDCGPSWGKN